MSDNKSIQESKLDILLGHEPELPRKPELFPSLAISPSNILGCEQNLVQEVAPAHPQVDAVQELNEETSDTPDNSIDLQRSSSFYIESWGWPSNPHYDDGQSCSHNYKRSKVFKWAHVSRKNVAGPADFPLIKYKKPACCSDDQDNAKKNEAPIEPSRKLSWSIFKTRIWGKNTKNCVEKKAGGNKVFPGMHNVLCRLGRCPYFRTKGSSQEIGQEDVKDIPDDSK